jgi:hypothetical protein
MQSKNGGTFILNMFHYLCEHPQEEGNQQDLALLMVKIVCVVFALLNRVRLFTGPVTYFEEYSRWS